jgi:hypothetical protein
MVEGVVEPPPINTHVAVIDGAVDAKLIDYWFLLRRCLCDSLVVCVFYRGCCGASST